jgi:hypothetical protein
MADEHGRPVIKWIENQERAFQQSEPEFGEGAGPDGNCEALAFPSSVTAAKARMSMAAH